ncbi:hypothetical protein JVU11DRAFT_4524 [Chiua virens]|nr:hypothetical protein JVU11DRAFT_4524 [Chiua virens]
MYNTSFDDAASCDLVANALATKLYPCGWLINFGQPCNTEVPGRDMPTHLRTVHRVNENQRLRCLWNGCSDELSSGCLGRHVQERHLAWRWACPRPGCEAIFTRRGVMEEHRTTCTR